MQDKIQSSDTPVDVVLTGLEINSKVPFVSGRGTKMVDSTMTPRPLKSGLETNIDLKYVNTASSQSCQVVITLFLRMYHEMVLKLG